MRIGLLATSRRYEDSFLGPAERLFEASGANLGNFAFVEALWRQLQPNVVILPWHVAREEARARCDLLVFAAANQLGSHTDLGDLAEHLEAIGLPLVAVGLGAQSSSLAQPPRLTGGTERWLRTLAALAPTARPNIAVRGEFTRRTLEKLGLGERAVTLGCPSNFLNSRPEFYAELSARASRRRVERLCVAAGSRHFSTVREVERQLVRLVAATGGAYVVQSDIEFLRFARGEPVSSAESEAIRAYLAPEHAPEALDLWRRRHAAAFADATSWLDAMHGFDFAVGARIHGVMLPIQAGVPGGVVAHDSRTLELCQTMGVPVRLPHEIPETFAADDLPKLFEFDVATFAATRERLRRAYVEFPRGCGIEPDARLTTLQAQP
jgi:hypothetical protein